jgi:hypothetical protein
MATFITQLSALNINFGFDGSNLTTEVTNAPLLYAHKIPFKCQDSKIIIGHVEPQKIQHVPIKTVSMDSLMQTFFTLLSNTKQFSIVELKTFTEHQENRCNNFIRLAYGGKISILSLFKSYMKVVTLARTITINFSAPLELINVELPQYINGFALMIIAGITNDILPSGFNSFGYHNRNGYISVKYSDRFMFEVNGKITPLATLEDAIEKVKQLNSYL